MLFYFVGSSMEFMQPRQLLKRNIFGRFIRNQGRFNCWPQKDRLNSRDQPKVWFCRGKYGFDSRMSTHRLHDQKLVTRQSLFADGSSHMALDTNQTHQKVKNLSMEHNCIQIICVSGHVFVRSLIVEPRDKHVTKWNLGITGPSCLSGLFYKHLI